MWKYVFIWLLRGQNDTPSWFSEEENYFKNSYQHLFLETRSLNFFAFQILKRSNWFVEQCGLKSNYFPFSPNHFRNISSEIVLILEKKKRKFALLSFIMCQ